MPFQIPPPSQYTHTWISKRKLREKIPILSHMAVFLILCLRSYSIVYILYSVTKKKKPGKKKGKRIVFQNQDLCAIYLSPFLPEPSHLLSSLIFPLSTNETSSPPRPHPVLKQPAELLHRWYRPHILQNRGFWPHLFSEVFCSLWPPTYSMSSYFICSLLFCPCKTRMWTLSADFPPLVSEQLSLTI